VKVLPKLPMPPLCDHDERPKGKPLCQACWDQYKPKFEEWCIAVERARGIGQA